MVNIKARFIPSFKNTTQNVFSTTFKNMVKVIDTVFVMWLEVLW